MIALFVSPQRDTSSSPVGHPKIQKNVQIKLKYIKIEKVAQQ